MRVGDMSAALDVAVPDCPPPLRVIATEDNVAPIPADSRTWKLTRYVRFPLSCRSVVAETAGSVMLARRGDGAVGVDEDPPHAVETKARRKRDQRATREPN
jgi:hypothetical protein